MKTGLFLHLSTIVLVILIYILNAQVIDLGIDKATLITGLAIAFLGAGVWYIGLKIQDQLDVQPLYLHSVSFLVRFFGFAALVVFFRLTQHPWLENFTSFIWQSLLFYLVVSALDVYASVKWANDLGKKQQI